MESLSHDIQPICLPAVCEADVLERFVKAEAMALWAVRSAQLQDVPPNVLTFLRKHEQDEQDHLKRFETMVGHAAHARDRLPVVPRQWPALAVQLYGYESLGLEFAKLLGALRPDLGAILKDEETHVVFFEREIQKILAGESVAADQARVSARAWWRKLPVTLNRYLQGETLAPFRAALADTILSAIERRMTAVGLFRKTAS